MTRRDGYKINHVIERGRETLKNVFCRTKKNKSGRRLPKTLLVDVKQSLRELWSPCHIGNQ